MGNSNLRPEIPWDESRGWDVVLRGNVIYLVSESDAFVDRDWLSIGISIEGGSAGTVVLLRLHSTPARQQVYRHHLVANEIIFRAEDVP